MSEIERSVLRVISVGFIDRENAENLLELPILWDIIGTGASRHEARQCCTSPQEDRASYEPISIGTRLASTVIETSQQTIWDR